MPIRDISARNASLDNDYGATAGAQAPASHDLALFAGDPMTNGVETAGGGYARANVPPAKWQPASGGMKSTDGPVLFPPTTEAWGDQITHWALFAADTEVMWDCAPLSEPLVVTGPGGGPEVNVSVFYDDSATGGTPT